MKKSMVLFILLWSSVARGGVGVNVNIDVPVPPPIVVAPTPGPPQVVLGVAPRFIFAPYLGFYVSVGIPYDIVYLDNNYYLNSGGTWYRGPNYNGPWKRAHHLPQYLRAHRYEEICHYRDMEYHEYQRDQNHYTGRWHEPERDGRGERHEGYGRDHEGHHEH